MKRAFRTWTLKRGIAWTAVVLALGVTGVTVFGAQRLQPPPAPDASDDSLALPDVAAASASEATAGGGRGVTSDPFRPDRRPPTARYKIGGERNVTVAPRPEFQALGGIRLMGTVVAPGGGVAALQLPGGTTQLVRVGQAVAGFKLKRVGPGTAVLVGADTTITLRMSEAAQGGNAP